MMQNRNAAAVIPLSKPDANILERLARVYGEPLARYFSRRVENSADIPDLVQEVLTRLARFGDLSAIRQPEHYLFRTASNVLRDRLRRRKVRHAEDHEIFGADVEDDAAFAADRVIEGKQAIEGLKVALRRLPERTRDVFVLRVFEGKATACVAQSLAISTRAVEAHYAKALAFMVRAVRDYRDN